MSVSLKVGGAWKASTPYIKVGGVWKAATVFLKVSGVWKELNPGGGGGGTPCSIGGSLSATGTGISILGPSRPVTVPSGNTGKLLFRNIVGPITPLISVAGGSYQEVNEEDTLTWTDAQSITARASGLGSGESLSFDIYDFDTNTLIQSVVLSKS